MCVPGFPSGGGGGPGNVSMFNDICNRDRMLGHVCNIPRQHKVEVASCPCMIDNYVSVVMLFYMHVCEHIIR